VKAMRVQFFSNLFYQVAVAEGWFVKYKNHSPISLFGREWVVLQLPNDGNAIFADPTRDHLLVPVSINVEVCNKVSYYENKYIQVLPKPSVNITVYTKQEQLYLLS
jgi:hypothetical protein